jgi:hypothetical protein
MDTKTTISMTVFWWNGVAQLVENLRRFALNAESCQSPNRSNDSHFGNECANSTRERDPAVLTGEQHFKMIVKDRKRNDFSSRLTRCLSKFLNAHRVAVSRRKPSLRQAFGA